MAYYPFYPQFQSQQTNVIWVDNEQVALSYPVAPGNTIMLMENDNPVVYKKTADLSGKVLPMEIYDLVKRVTEDHVPVEYITKNEFESFVSRIEARLSEFEDVPKRKKVRKDESVQND